MADPLPAETIAQIRELAAAGLSRAEIARRTGVSTTSVGRHAPPGSFDRSGTMAATKARTADMAARRAQLADNLLTDAVRLREQLWQPYTVYAFGGRDNTYNEHHLDEPPTDAKRALMQTAVAAATQHLRLVDHDADGGVDQARGLVHGFMDAIAQRAAQLADPTADPT
jgi:hypothetical protein